MLPVNLGILTPATSPKQQPLLTSPNHILSNGSSDDVTLPLTPISPNINKTLNFSGKTNNPNTNHINNRDDDKIMININNSNNTNFINDNSNEINRKNHNDKNKSDEDEDVEGNHNDHVDKNGNENDNNNNDEDKNNNNNNIKSNSSNNKNENHSTDGINICKTSNSFIIEQNSQGFVADNVLNEKT